MMMLKKCSSNHFSDKMIEKDMYIDLNETDGILYLKFRNEMVMALVVVVVF